MTTRLLSINFFDDDELGSAGASSGAVSMTAAPRRTNVLIWSAVAIAVVALGTVPWFHLSATRKARHYRALVAQQAADSAPLAASLQTARRLAHEDSAYTKRVAEIRRRDAGRFVWPHILTELNEAVPPGVWLTEISEAPNTTPVTVVVRGSSLDVGKVTEFFTRLQASAYFGPPQFAGSDPDPVSGSIANFSVYLPYREPTDRRLRQTVRIEAGTLPSRAVPDATAPTERPR
ncbi:MAG: PilN domain-containing protein [Gemmatimonadaceae bacterium]